jgi:CO/xanthine dehydrogenase FAD-binding subunit
MALAEFQIGPRRTALRPDEVMTALLVPMPHADAQSHFIKLGARKYQLISIVMGAAVLQVEAGKVVAAALAIGACSPVARRLGELEATLIGASIADLGRHLKPSNLASLTPIDDIRADAIYRRDAAMAVARRLLTHFEGAA